MRPVDARLLSDIGALIAAAQGRAVLVGGCVRDQLLGITPKDYDIEVYGLDATALSAALAHFGPVKQFGASFPVQQVRHLPIDFALPRGADFAASARCRDLTINSMGRDLVTGELLDPCGGQNDIAHKRLMYSDRDTFGSDPLRGLRVCQLAARFDMAVDPQLVALCRGLDLSGVAAERLLVEFRKLLMMPARPSVGLRLLRETQLLRFFPELAALVDVPQDPIWHPEGDVWVHTLMVVDEAAALRRGDASDAALMFGALLHDVGKPKTTTQADGKVRSPGHDAAGVEIAAEFLGKLKAPIDLTAAVKGLVRYHLSPAILSDPKVTDRAYRRLVRGLGEYGLDVELLLRVARADHLGRTTPEALQRVFPQGDTFAARIAALKLEQGTPDVVLGRHLQEHGIKPGPHMKEILAACRDVQDETGWTEVERILGRVLKG